MTSTKYIGMDVHKESISWLQAAPLSLFLPAGITEAMKRAFLEAQPGLRIRKEGTKVGR
jgi:hypothetical protein